MLVKLLNLLINVFSKTNIEDMKNSMEDFNM